MRRPPPPTSPTPGKKSALTVIDGEGAPATTALVARWPDVVAKLDDAQREAHVRLGHDTVIYDEVSDTGERRTRGFVKCVLRVPVGRSDGNAYAVFVEVERDAYAALKAGFKDKRAVTVSGTLANRLPHIEEAFGSEVKVIEDGSDNRARVVDAAHPVLLQGPVIGP